MKKLLAGFLATLIGTCGVVCIDQEARNLAETNSQNISQVQDIAEMNQHNISVLQEKVSNHTCKKYDYLEEQYNELNSKYEELSSICAENKKTEYKVGDIVEIPIILQENTENAIIEQSYVTITGINEHNMEKYYEVEVTVKGELVVPTQRTYVIWFVLSNKGNDANAQKTVRIEWPSNQTGKHTLDGVCLKTVINKIYLENNTVPIYISVQYY